MVTDVRRVPGQGRLRLRLRPPVDADSLLLRPRRRVLVGQAAMVTRNIYQSNTGYMMLFAWIRFNMVHRVDQ